MRLCVLPVVEDAVDHQPLHLDSVTVKLLFHVDKERIFVLPLGALVIITFASKVHRGRFVHVSLPLVVTEHHLAVQLQLEKSDREEVKRGPSETRTEFEHLHKDSQTKLIFNYRWIQFHKVCVPVAPAPKSSASKTYCTI